MFRLSHIAIAVPNVEEIKKKLEVISLSVSEEKVVPTEKVKTTFVPFEVSKPPHLEFLEPTEKNSSIGKFLEKKSSGGLHHICFEVTHLDSWQEKLKENGFEIIPPGIRKGAHGRVLFIHPKSFAGVLLELEERT